MAVARNVSARLLTALLEEGGFDPGAKDALSMTPLGQAAGRGRTELVDAMLAYARKRPGGLESAFRCCLASDGHAPGLFMIIMGGRQLEMVKHLLASVAQAELPGLDLFQSAVLEACRGHNVPALRFLLAPGRAAEYGARPVDVNARGQGADATLLHAVFAQPPQVLQTRKSGEMVGTVEALLEAGADPTARDEGGKTPVQRARALGFVDAAERMERVANKGQRKEAARAAEAELLGLLEEEEAKASKKQQKKGKGKGGGAGKGGEPEGATAAAAGLTVVSLADSDGEEEEGKAAAVAAGEQEHSEEGPLQGAAQLPPLSEEEAFVLARAEVEAPDFVCPLLRRVMRDVALASDGFSYERAAIEAHIRRCQAAGRTPDSPTTGEKIDSMLLPNRGLMNLIDTFQREQRQAFRALGGGGGVV